MEKDIPSLCLTWTVCTLCGRTIYRCLQKRMRITNVSDNIVQLRGYGYDSMGGFIRGLWCSFYLLKMRKLYVFN